jgi:hypothetical protein
MRRFLIVIVLSLAIPEVVLGQSCAISDLHVENYKTPNHPSDLRRVMYTYSCIPQGIPVLISGIGITKGSGSMDYLTQDSKITLSYKIDDDKLGLLKEFAVVPNSVEANGGNAEVPNSAEFPEDGMPDKEKVSDFPDRIARVLDRRFGTHYVVASTGAHKAISCYLRLPAEPAENGAIPAVPPSIVAELAVEIVYADKSPDFSLHFVTREQGSKSRFGDWQTGHTDVVLSAAKAYAILVFNEVKASQ